MTILLAEEVKQVVSEELPAWIEEQPDLRLRLRQAIGKIPGELLSKQHQLIVGFLEKVLGTFVERHNLGVVLGAPFQMRLEHGREPDLLFVASEHLDRLQETYLDGPADMVVEIVSPEGAGRDRGDKLYEYARGGVPEYWLIDPQEKSSNEKSVSLWCRRVHRWTSFDCAQDRPRQKTQKGRLLGPWC